MLLVKTQGPKHVSSRFSQSLMESTKVLHCGHACNWYGMVVGVIYLRIERFVHKLGTVFSSRRTVLMPRPFTVAGALVIIPSIVSLSLRGHLPRKHC